MEAVEWVLKLKSEDIEKLYFGISDNEGGNTQPDGQATTAAGEGAFWCNCMLVTSGVFGRASPKGS
jgi:hypothetical protein